NLGNHRHIPHRGVIACNVPILEISLNLNVIVLSFRPPAYREEREATCLNSACSQRGKTERHNEHRRGCRHYESSPKRAEVRGDLAGEPWHHRSAQTGAREHPAAVAAGKQGRGGKR